MRIASTQTYIIDGAHDLGEIARIIGAKVGGKFIADSPNDVLNGYLTQQVDTLPDGSQQSKVTVYFYADDEDPIVPETIEVDDPEEVKQIKIRKRQFAHPNPFRKLKLTEYKESLIAGELKKIQAGKLKVRSHDQAVEEARRNEKVRRQKYFDEQNKRKPLQKPSIPLD